MVGSKRSSSSNGSPSPIPTQDLGLCLSSAAPTSRSSPGSGAAGGGSTDAAVGLSSGGVSDVAGGGSGDSLPSGVVGDASGGSAAVNLGGATGGQVGEGTDARNAIIVEGDDPVVKDGDGNGQSGKRQKRCTSRVWDHFTKKDLVIEDNGKIYTQKWAYCNHPKCRFKGRCETNYGTTGFWTHLKVAHCVVKNQPQLIVAKDVKAVIPYRYDEEASLRKFYLAIVMHEILLDDWSLSEDTTICAMSISMSRKFEKYWKKSSTTLAVACFLDPRYKKRLIEFYMRKFHGSASYVHVDELVDIIKKLYQFYVNDALMSSRPKSKSNETSDMDIDTADLLVDNEDEELESYLYESSGHEDADMNELDKYMADPPLRLTGSFDILSWWKNRTDEYPVLSRMAHDLLAVQVSTVASESAFSAGGRVVDPFRSRLEPETVEALICLKDWSAAAKREKKVGSIVGDLEVIEALVSKLHLEDDDVADSDGGMNGQADDF